MLIQVQQLRLMVALGCWLIGSASAWAGWFGLRNNLDCVVVVQESCGDTGTSCRSAPQRLYPGETSHDGQPGRAARHITIFDPHQPTRPLYQGPVPATSGDVYLAIERGPNGAVRLIPIVPSRKLEQAVRRSHP